MIDPRMVDNATISTAVQLAPDKVPKLQNVIERACGSRAIYDRNPIALMKSAFTASPVSNNITTEARLSSCDLASKNTSQVETTPPTQAAIGRLQRLPPMCSTPPKTKNRAEPNAAPLEVPINPG